MLSLCLGHPKRTTIPSYLQPYSKSTSTPPGTQAPRHPGTHPHAVSTHQGRYELGLHGPWPCLQSAHPRQTLPRQAQGCAPCMYVHCTLYIVHAVGTRLCRHVRANGALASSTECPLWPPCSTSQVRQAWRQRPDSRECSHLDHAYRCRSSVSEEGPATRASILGWPGLAGLAGLAWPGYLLLMPHGTPSRPLNHPSLIDNPVGIGAFFV